MKLKKRASTTVVAAALGAAALGLGPGTAQADDWPFPPPPPVPDLVGPGPALLPPPGHLNKIPPGHWDIAGIKINPGFVNHL